MRWFYSALLVVTLLLCIAIEGGISKGLFNKPSYWIAIVSVLAITTGLIYYRLQKIDSQSFTQSYLLTIVVKLLLGGIMISVIIFIDKAAATENAITFIIAYFLFTALEVFFLFQKINNPKKTI